VHRAFVHGTVMVRVVPTQHTTAVMVMLGLELEISHFTQVLARRDGRRRAGREMRAARIIHDSSLLIIF
jgi:hypothetical protein